MIKNINLINEIILVIRTVELIAIIFVLVLLGSYVNSGREVSSRHTLMSRYYNC